MSEILVGVAFSASQANIILHLLMTQANVAIQITDFLKKSVI
ncbi:hypothetical protein FDUTEX481_00682 [Tolypothrix sp. PCC 7601]|nr:hypothetical protein FDUTEX481_00682 [Tolypothrix sp. PCC 7601]